MTIKIMCKLSADKVRSVTYNVLCNKKNNIEAKHRRICTFVIICSSLNTVLVLHLPQITSVCIVLAFNRNILVI